MAELGGFIVSLSTGCSFLTSQVIRSERITMAMSAERSPGPAAYDILDKPIRQGKVKLMGTAHRFYPEPDHNLCIPGPGQYKLSNMVGGRSPDKPSQPIVAFSKAHLRNREPV